MNMGFKLLTIHVNPKDNTQFLLISYVEFFIFFTNLSTASVYLLLNNTSKY